MNIITLRIMRIIEKKLNMGVSKSRIYEDLAPPYSKSTLYRLYYLAIENKDSGDTLSKLKFNAVCPPWAEHIETFEELYTEKEKHTYTGAYLYGVWE